MTDNPNRKGLSRRVVVASYVISIAGFLGSVMFLVSLFEGDPLSGVLQTLLLIPWDCAEFSGIEKSSIRLFQLLFLLPGLSGFLISVWQPNRVGWFICGHFCLIVYYGTWPLLVFVGLMLEGVHC
jgi:hypothetical protein